MQKTSVTQSANYAALAGMIVMALGYFGIEIPAEQVVVVIAGLVTLGGILTSLWNRYSKGDMGGLITKK